MNPKEDGITHINVYSKGNTELGRYLSNFQKCTISTPEGIFNSIEGYWYYLTCGDEDLKELYGWQAKDQGRKSGGKDWVNTKEFKDKICLAIENKLFNMPVNLKKELKELNKPLVHYYVYNNKVIEPKQGKWILDCIIEYKDKLNV